MLKLGDELNTVKLRRDLGETATVFPLGCLCHSVKAVT